MLNVPKRNSIMPFDTNFITDLNTQNDVEEVIK